MVGIYNGVIYALYACGKDGEYKDVYTSVLANWAGLEYGLKYFDFLGAGPAKSDYDVRDFKAKFGGELVSYGRFLRINNKSLYNLGKIGLKIYSKLK